MMTLKRSVAAALLSCMIVFAASGQSGNEKRPTLFTINDRPVSTEEFTYLYRKNHQHKPEEFTEDKIESYLDLFINYKLKVEEALARGMDTTTAFRKEYQTYRDELLKPYLPDAKVIDSLVNLTYGRLKEEVSASHILINVKPDAPPSDTLQAYEKILAVRKRALAGEDFGDLAATYSEEPGAQVSRGSLGYFTALQMVFPFEQAAYLTNVGSISEPVRTQFGYHILKVHGRRPSRGEVEVSHIMIRTGDVATSEHAKNTIFDVYDKLQKGMPWDELCLQYSEDPGSKDKGGRLRPFGVGGMSSVPEFQEMAFALKEPGEISDPFQTQFGWHIIRLENKIPLPSFEELKGSLTQRVSRDERVQISQNALRKRMRREFGYAENPSIAARIMELPDSVLMKQDGTDGERIQDEVLFTMQGRPYLVRDFLHFLAERDFAAVSGSATRRQQILEYADAVQIQLLEEKVKRESPEYKWLLKEYYEGILLFEIMEEKVWNRAMEDSAGQRQFFERNRGKYTAGERMAGKIYSSQSKAYLAKLKDLLPLEDSLQAFIAKNKIRREEGTFEKSERAVLSAIPWTPGAHPGSNNGMQYLVVIEKILPPGPESFEEARASVISDYQTWLEESWIAQLKQKFGIKVERKARKRAFAELMKS